MKSKFFVAALVSFAFVAESFASKPTDEITREIAISASFQKIVVGNDINVVLVQDYDKSSVSILGDEKSVQYIQAFITNDQLTISSKKNLTGKKITVYVPVKSLSDIELSAGSSVSSEGLLKLEHVTIVVNAGSHVALKTLGEITIRAAEDCDFVYEKNERFKVIPAAF